jgi:hypothetical protein
LSARVVRLAALCSVLLCVTGCGGKLFRNDHRIAILEPRKFATVDQPLTVTWRAKNFEAPSDGHFLVLVDKDPMPPGQTVAYFRRNRLDVYTVDEPRFTVDTFTAHTGGTKLERNHHDVTVVLLDRQGRRIGESAGFVEFDVRTPS